MIVFLVLWLTSKSSKARSEKEQYDKGFSEGYWMLGDIVAKELDKKAIDRKELEKYVSRNGEAAIEEVAEPSPNEAIILNEDIPYLEQAIAENRHATAQVSTPHTQAVVLPVKTKQEVTERNLNVLLYMASFLIVAAAAAFIATSMPPLVRLAGLWLVIVAFYGTGLILHAKVSYLKSAATAFIGTGLALVPFAGIALSQLGGMPGGVAWFLTSVVGVCSYAIATLRLRSEVVGYLTVAFSLSLATSSIAAVSGPIVLYFVALIIVSLVFHVLARSKATWIPDLFKLPISHTSQLLTPVTLLASLFAYDTMTLVSYQIVFWVATLYYGVLWVTEKQSIYEQVTRLLVSISAYLSVANIYNFEATASMYTILGIGVVQAIYSLIRVRAAVPKSRTIETIWLLSALLVLLMTLSFWIFTDQARVGITLQVGVIFVMSILATIRFRSVYYAVPALFASVALPFIVGRWPGEELLGLQVLTWKFIAVSGLALAAYVWLRDRSVSVKGFFQSAFWVYILVAFFTSFAQGSTIAFIASAIGIATATAAASYTFKQWFIEIIPAILVVPIMTLLFREMNIASEWMNVVVIGSTTVVYALALGAHHYAKEVSRRTLLTVFTVVLGFGLVFSYGRGEAVGIVALLLTLFYAVISLLFRSVLTMPMLKGLFSVAYVLYPLITLLLATNVSTGWVVLAFATLTTVYWIGSYVERVPAVMVFGNLALIGFVMTTWSWLKLDMSWFAFGVAWITAGIFYVMTLLYTFKFNDSSRYGMQLIFTWIVLGFVTLLHIMSAGKDGYAAAATLIAIAGTIAVHGAISKRLGIIEAALYVATLGVQRIVGIAAPDMNIAFYGHWWALTLLLVAFWRKDVQFSARLIIATACVTVGSGVMALSSGGNYQILFLVEHVGLLVAGVLARASWALWWGLSATVLAVLYFLRSSLFLSLLFLGLTLLAVVIWRLVRANRKK